MTDVILCAASNLFRMYVISRFMKTLIGEPRASRKMLFFAYGTFYVVNTALFLLLHLSWVNLLCNLMGISLIACLYTRSVKLAFFTVVSYSVIAMACEFIIISLFTNYEEGQIFNQILQVLSVLLSIIFELLAERFIRTQRNDDSVYSIALLLVPLSSIVVNIILTNTDSVTNIGLIVLNLGFLLSDFLIFYLYDLLSETLYERYENASMRLQLGSYSSQMQILKESDEKVKALRHDMKHHMNEIRLMAKQDKTQEIQNYIDDMENSVSNPKEMVYSGNWEIDSILNYMLEQAKKELRTVDVQVQLPEKFSHTFDLNVILGNLLENAIEGAGQTEEKRLKLRIVFQKGILQIEIENSFCGKMVRKREIFFTTKPDKAAHGIGLNNVRKIVEKYNGLMEVRSGKDIFFVKVMLYI